MCLSGLFQIGLCTDPSNSACPSVNRVLFSPYKVCTRGPSLWTSVTSPLYPRIRGGQNYEVHRRRLVVRLFPLSTVDDSGSHTDRDTTDDTMSVINTKGEL